MFEEIAMILNTAKEYTFVIMILVLYIFGVYLKKYTPMSNKLIPSAIFVAGVVLGVVLIEKTIIGAFLGLITAYLTIAFHSHITNTLEAIFDKTSRG